MAKMFKEKCNTKGTYTYPPKSMEPKAQHPYDLEFEVETPALPRGATDAEVGAILREAYGSHAAAFRHAADNLKTVRRQEVVAAFQAECRGEEKVSESERGY